MLQVYTDIIELSYLGEQKVHLLDVIPIKYVFGRNDTLTTSKRPITDEKGIVVVSFNDRLLISV